MSKIHTLTEDFTSLSDWLDITADFGFTPNGSSIVASGGQGAGTIIGNPSGLSAVLIGPTTGPVYELNDSWLSLDIVEYDTATDGSAVYSAYIGAVDDTFSNTLYMAVQYSPGTDQITFFNGTILATIANPGLTITVGFMITSDTIYYSYSTDGGSSWTSIGSLDLTGVDITSSIWQPFIGAIGLTVTSTWTTIYDNFNAVQPPLPPISVDISDVSATASVHADPRVRIVIGPNLVKDLSAMSPTGATVEALPPDALLLGLLVDTASATITSEALPPDSIAFGPYYVTFTPAVLGCIAIPPLSVDLGETDPIIEVLPAEVLIEANTTVSPVVGSFVQGDPFYYPWTISETGTRSFDMTDMTADSPAGGAIQFAGLPRTQWFRYSSAFPAVLTITGSSAEDWLMTHYEEDNLDELTWEFPSADVVGVYPAAGINTDHITVNISTGYTYFSLHSNTDDDITLTWTYVRTDSDLLVDVINPIEADTPDTLTVAVQGGADNESIRFTWSPPVSDLIPGTMSRPITLATISSDAEGNIYIGSIPIPAAYSGDYVLTATGVSSNRIGTVTFSIPEDPLPDDDSTTESEPVAATTIKWLWDDGRGHTWVMTNNPDRMTSVVLSKALTPERSTSGSGQHVIWQGATPAMDWSFSGVVMDEDDYDEFEFFYNLNRKFYITTHRNKIYVVTFKNLDMKPKRNGSNFWTFDYTASLFLFREK